WIGTTVVGLSGAGIAPAVRLSALRLICFFQLPRAEGLGYHAPAPKSAAPRGWTAEGGCPYTRKAFTSRTPLCIIIALRPGRSSAHILRRAGPSFPELAPRQREDGCPLGLAGAEARNQRHMLTRL